MSKRHAKKHSWVQRIFSNRAVIAVLIVAAIAIIGLSLDMAANAGKAYGNISVNGIAVGGMSEEEIADKLKSEYGSRISHAQVTIYSNEEARGRAKSAATEEELATAEEVSAEEAFSSIDTWTTDALSLKANMPYDEAAKRALSIGREDGGLPARISLFSEPEDIELDVKFDEDLLDALASEIDRAVGDPRVDTTVVVEEGIARPVEGHDGTLVDRAWLASMISDAMIRGDVPDSFVAKASNAPSRISIEDAHSMAASINQAIENGAVFIYEGRSWLASPTELGNWTDVRVAGEEGAWHLEASIDSSLAVPSVMKGSDAAITSDDMVVRFEKNASGVQVRTQGSGNIPEVTPAVAELEERLYGPDGLAWGQSVDSPVEIHISETDRPETLSFNEALALGVISVIGEYTTEFSNLEGTENRNHNIKLCADILDNAIVDADGGTWNFNERSGDTNEEAGFWSAGSIVDGEFVDSIGGGICQIATTIFNAVYEAGLDVVERHNHTLYIGSYPTGRDAAVSYPDLDFIWKNDLPSDILLHLSYTDSSVTAQLYSVSTGFYTTTETGSWQEGEKYSVVYERDESLGSGNYYLKTIGEDGSKITVERTVYDKNDKVVKLDSFASEYEPKDQVYVIGPDVDTSELKREEDSSSNSSASDEYGDYDGSGYDDEASWY